MTRLRFDLRLAVAAGLALVAGLGVLVLTRPADRVAVLMAAEPLPAGVPLADAPLREVRAEPLDGLLLLEEADSIRDWTLAVSVPSGTPLTHAMLAPPGNAVPDLIGLTLDRANAVQGRLTPGDLVDIYITDDDGTRLLARSVQVVSAEVGTGGLSGTDVALLLAVEDRSLVPDLVEAVHAAAVDLVLVSS